MRAEVRSHALISDHHQSVQLLCFLTLIRSTLWVISCDHLRPSFSPVVRVHFLSRITLWGDLMRSSLTIISSSFFACVS